VASSLFDINWSFLDS